MGQGPFILYNSIMSQKVISHVQFLVPLFMGHVRSHVVCVVVTHPSPHTTPLQPVGPQHAGGPEEKKLTGIIPQDRHRGIFWESS